VSFEGESFGSHYVESSLWKRLWTCRKTDYLNEINTVLGSPLGIQVVETTRISRQSPHEDGKVSSTHRPPLPSRRYSCYPFLFEAESTAGPRCGRKEYGNEKSQTPSGIEPATFRLLAQCLNRLRYRVRRDIAAIRAFECVWEFLTAVNTKATRFSGQ
jgi:hypothetical protein